MLWRRMKRLLLIAGIAFVLFLVGSLLWTVAGLPPVRLVWRYGFSYGPEPTGRKITVEGVTFVEIGPGCFRMGAERVDDGDRFWRVRRWLGLRAEPPSTIQPRESYERRHP